MCVSLMQDDKLWVCRRRPTVSYMNLLLMLLLLLPDTALRPAPAPPALLSLPRSHSRPVFTVVCLAFASVPIWTTSRGHRTWPGDGDGDGDGDGMGWDGMPRPDRGRGGESRDEVQPSGLSRVTEQR